GREAAELALDFSGLVSKDAPPDSLEDRIRMLGEMLQQATTRREQLELEVMQLNKAMFQTARMRDEASANSAKSEQKLVTLRNLLNLYASTRDEIYRELEDTRRQYVGLKQEIGNRIEKESLLTAEVADLRERLNRMSVEHTELLTRIHDSTNENVA